MSLDVLNIEVMKRIIYKIVNNSSILSEDWKQMMIFIKDRINIGKIKERVPMRLLPVKLKEGIKKTKWKVMLKDNFTWIRLTMEKFHLIKLN